MHLAIKPQQNVKFHISKVRFHGRLCRVWGEMVLLGRIELPTSALPRMRSTTELQQHTISAWPLSPANRRGGQGRANDGGMGLCQATFRPHLRQDLQEHGAIGIQTGMSDPKSPTSREERLAARLRENLKRRKAQARAMGTVDVMAAESPDSPETGLSNPAA